MSVGEPRERGRWGEGDPGKEGGRKEKGSRERGRERGSEGDGKEGERRRDSHLHPGPPPRHLERAAGEKGRRQRAGCPAAARGARPTWGGVRARAPSRAPSKEKDPSPPGPAALAREPPSPSPYSRPAGRAVGLSRQTRESEAEQTLGELFPLAWKFIGNTCSGEAGHGEGEGREFSAPAPARVPPGSRPLGRDRGAPPPGAPRGRSPGQLRRDRPGGRGERAGESGRGVERAGRPGWSPGEAAGSSLTLMIFLWNVHPRVLIDHGPKIVLKGKEATKRKKWQNTPKRVWIKSLLRGRLSCKIQGSRGSAVFLLPF